MIVNENTAIAGVDTKGNLFMGGGDKVNFDMVFNATGPWTKQLLGISSVRCKNDLDLIRGSHLIIDRKISSPFVFQNTKDESLSSLF